MHALLDRHGPVTRRRRRRPRAQGTPLSQPLQPSDLWCADYKGEFMLAGHRCCYPLTVGDFASSYLLACDALSSTCENFAVVVFERAFKDFGLPRAIRTDNGVPFACPRALFGLSKLTAEKPRPVEPVDFPAYSEKSITTLELFRVPSWELPHLTLDPEETRLLGRFAAVGIAPGKAFDPAALDEPTRKAMEAGLAAGLARIRARAAYAMKAICLNSPEEAYYPAANVDAKGDPLDGSKHRYAIRFQSGHLPPARYFWSLTMYRKSDGLLVETPIKRYSIGDRTTGLKHGNDGSLTVHLQHDSPGADKESNWLPAPNEPLLRPRAHLWVARATFPP